MKKKGSALVFSVLMLAFFLALSLNIYFLARKKGERAGVKVAGEKTTNNIDMASSLGYQELLLAEAFVREGFPYSYNHTPIRTLKKDGVEVFDTYYKIDGTSTTSGDGFYLNLTDGTYSESYAGIQINNFIDFFSANWDFESGGSDSQKLIIGEETDADDNIKRTWQSAGIPDKRTQLWEEGVGTLQSIGGYKLTAASDISSANNPPDSGSYSAIYEKEVHLPTYIGSTTVSGVTFTITVTESFSSDGSTISGRKIDEFVIETN